MNSFKDSVDIGRDKALLRDGKLIYSCGLELGDKSTKDIRSDHYSRNQDLIMQEAHRKHHDKEDTKYVRGSDHNSRATLYYTDGEAWCSCGYNPFA